MSAVHRLVADKQKNDDRRSDAKTNEPEYLYEDNEQNPHKFERISKLIAPLRKVGNRDE